jgi:hypothetical protein
MVQEPSERYRMTRKTLQLPIYVGIGQKAG